MSAEKSGGGREWRKTLFKGAARFVVVEALFAGIIDHNGGTDVAADHLRAWGYTAVNHTDTDVLRAPFECGLDDSILYEFTATRPDGSAAILEVCSGAFDHEPDINDLGLAVDPGDPPKEPALLP